MNFRLRNAAEQCKTAFLRCLAHDRLDLFYIRSAQGNFNLWCVELEVTNSDDDSTLDHRLREREDIRKMYGDCLGVLLRALIKYEQLLDTIYELGGNSRQTVSVSNKTRSGGSHSSFGHGESGPLALMGQSRYIRTAVNQLTQNPLAIEKSGNTYRFEQADSVFDEASFDGFRNQLAMIILMAAYPDSTDKGLWTAQPAATDQDYKRLNPIQLRLIYANLLRRNRILWKTKHQTPSFASLRNAGEDFQHTGKGTGSDWSSSFTPQITRIGARQTYPRSPTPSANGSLICPYCHTDLPEEFSNTECADSWRSHIDYDIVPYSCIAEGCDTPNEMYLTSENLLDHMAAKHSVEQWTCDYCSSDSGIDGLTRKFNTAAQWQAHVALEHASIIPAESRATFSELNKRAMIGPLECPLCPYVMHCMDTRVDDHILQHLHDFALRSLPGSLHGDNVAINVSRVSEATAHTAPLNTHSQKGLSYSNSRPWNAIRTSNQLKEDDLRNSATVSREPKYAALETAEQERSSASTPDTPKIPRSHRYMSPLKIVIAIDFGTTYSGIAWASTDEPEKLNVVDRWGVGARTANKVPTVLYYDNGGSTGSFKWGYQAQRELTKGRKIHEWFKLGLCPEFERRRAAVSDLNQKFPSPTALPSLERVGDSERLVVDYLKGIKAHVDDQLAAVDRQIARISRKYIITVPAVWDHKEQDRTRNCAERAGLGKGDQLQVIAESEAAAIWALDRMMKLKLEVGDTFVVCDAGGRTVDLSSYTIEALNPVIKVIGAAKSSGELCGSSYLNRIFGKHLQDRMKGYQGGWDHKWLDLAISEFENRIKVEFTGNDNDDHFVYMPSLADSRRYGVKDGSLLLEGSELRECVFDQVIGRIQQLVEDQIAHTPKPVKRVLLAGGFGQSAYLKQQLQRQPSIKHQRILVEHIDQSDTSIMRGALIAGLTRHDQTHPDKIRVPRPVVVSRIAAKSWGTCAFDSIRNSSDQARAKIQPGGEYLVECMQWFIQQDTCMRDLEPKTFPFHKEQSVYSGSIGEVTIDIYEFSKPLVNDNPAPRYPDDPGVKKCLSLTMDLTGMNVPIETHYGQPVYVAKFEIVVILESASLSFIGRYDGREFPAKRLIFN